MMESCMGGFLHALELFLSLDIPLPMDLNVAYFKDFSSFDNSIWKKKEPLDLSLTFFFFAWMILNSQPREEKVEEHPLR